ncbi:transcriptional repressor [Elizabethkingia meningoseptica]|uniref:Fur family transcriptional regulator n=1 Tax=Elizabethkingia meningoseptica TaxID=238 RepID=UPI0022F17FE8|nr:transcriptional repressor [Elizabethkingia meningoseptica]EJK5330141.1 transcriptional repressor [Elizabethkingia meningoseptica]MDE5467800.1 transcriptional repressor [Elizabethkingia meningoseptica]MDE5474719.1 transcriptional repressor [Elizabethkingia meningoseptica]MDE5478152.1 transcriptional repressor [Elizabethkingia meningoseptica]MDE5486059.1 transcriptional repressor [Elizabethkingia meningoseptica]
MGKRNTKAKQLILDVLQSEHTALCHETFQVRLQGSVDRATIYRVLNSFCDDGIVHRIISDEGKLYFALCEVCRDHNHFHFRCVKCKKVSCMRDELSVNLPDGYAVMGVNAFVSGYCPNCKEKEV